MNWEFMWEIVEEEKIPIEIIKVIQSIYADSQKKIKWIMAISKYFKIMESENDL